MSSLVKLPIPANQTADLFIPGKTPVLWNGSTVKVDNKSLHNTGLVLANHEVMQGGLAYNIFADEIILRICPPWENADTFKVHGWNDDDTTRCRMWLETQGFRIGKNDLTDVVIAVAKRIIINPPRDYFERLEWDRKPRLDTWLTYYCGAESQNETYIKLAGSKWLIGGVARIYNPGCKFDISLILEGDQYIGKSLAFDTLATIGGERFFTDDSIEFQNKDSLLKLQGKLIVEMAELATWKRAESDDVKAFITRRVDLYRPPYARKTIERPRMFIIGGSTNPNGGYFKDHTGNRRYLPVKCGRVDVDALKKDTEQLWAEAVHRFKLNEQIWLTWEENKLAGIEQDLRVDEDVIGENIDETVIELEKRAEIGFSINDILTKLGIAIDRRSPNLKSRIQSHLTLRGYELTRVRDANNSMPRRWTKKKELKPIHSEEE